MVVLQNIVLKKTNPYLKYFLNHKNSLFVCQISAKHLGKPLILQKNHMARSHLRFATIATILKSSFLWYFLT